MEEEGPAEERGGVERRGERVNKSRGALVVNCCQGALVKNGNLDRRFFATV